MWNDYENEKNFLPNEFLAFENNFVLILSNIIFFSFNPKVLFLIISKLSLHFFRFLIAHTWLGSLAAKVKQFQALCFDDWLDRIIFSTVLDNVSLSHLCVQSLFFINCINPNLDWSSLFFFIKWQDVHQFHRHSLWYLTLFNEFSSENGCKHMRINLFSGHVQFILEMKWNDNDNGHSHFTGKSLSSSRSPSINRYGLCLCFSTWLWFRSYSTVLHFKKVFLRNFEALQIHWWFNDILNFIRVCKTKSLSFYLF